MSIPQVFSFDSLSVRVNLDATGQAWFNANDVCEALEMGNSSQAIKSHVDQDDLQKLEVIDSLGRSQKQNHVNESGLYSLIFGSTKESAKRFKRWVTAEVLPSLHKTGSYSVQQPSTTVESKATETAAVLMMVHDFVLKNVPGINPGIAAAATLDCIKQNTGVDMEPMRRALPAAAELPSSMNATQLGKEVGLSGRAVNKALAELGFQAKNERNEWELSPDGAKWGEALPFSRNGHSGYQLLWNPSVLELIKTRKTA